MEKSIVYFPVNTYIGDITPVVVEGVAGQEVENYKRERNLCDSELQFAEPQLLENVKEERNRNGIDANTESTSDSVTCHTSRHLLDCAPFSYLELENNIIHSAPFCPSNLPWNSNVQLDQESLYGYNWYNGWLNHTYGRESISLPVSETQQSFILKTQLHNQNSDVRSFNISPCVNKPTEAMKNTIQHDDKILFDSSQTRHSTVAQKLCDVCKDICSNDKLYCWGSIKRKRTESNEELSSDVLNLSVPSARFPQDCVNETEFQAKCGGGRFESVKKYTDFLPDTERKNISNTFMNESVKSCFVSLTRIDHMLFKSNKCLLTRFRNEQGRTLKSESCRLMEVEEKNNLELSTNRKFSEVSGSLPMDCSNKTNDIPIKTTVESSSIISSDTNHPDSNMVSKFNSYSQFLEEETVADLVTKNQKSLHKKMKKNTENYEQGIKECSSSEPIALNVKNPSDILQHTSVSSSQQREMEDKTSSLYQESREKDFDSLVRVADINSKYPEEKPSYMHENIFSDDTQSWNGSKATEDSKIMNKFKSIPIDAMDTSVARENKFIGTPKENIMACVSKYEISQCVKKKSLEVESSSKCVLENEVLTPVSENMFEGSRNKSVLTCDKVPSKFNSPSNVACYIDECETRHDLDTNSNTRREKSCLDKRKIQGPSRRSTSKRQEAERTRCHISYLLNRLPDLAKIFEIHKKVGVGTFSSVFLGTIKQEVADQYPELHSRKFAIKHLIPTILPKRVARELKFLQQIGGKENVIGVDLCIREGDCCVFVMPYLSHRRFSDYVLEMDAEETRDYVHNLMIALRRVHSFDVIHRDVKPTNFLYNRESRRYLLVDFGLSQSVCPQSKWTSDAKKRKRQEENSCENSKCGNEMENKFVRNDLRVKRMALHTRSKEENNVQVSQPLKRQKLTDSSDRSQKMIRHLQKETPSVIESKRAPLTPKVSNKQNVLSAQTFKLPYSSPKVLQKELSIRKKLFASNNENELPKTCGTSVKVESSRSNMSSPFLSKKTVLTPKSNQTNFDISAHSPDMLSNDSSKQKFQTLVPKPKDGSTGGSTIVRVQNSQVKSQVLKPLSPLESEMQRKLLLKKHGGKKPMKETKCFCRGLAQVCNTCLKQQAIPAPRAGTPGFRPPEVLLKYPMQTTAVDMWAAGVIMLCILSGCYPFFRSPDDITALAEIMTVFGTDSIQSVARGLGRTVLCGNKRPPLDLRKLCERLRRRRKDVIAGVPDTISSLPLCPKCDNTIDDCDGCLCLEENSTPIKVGEFPASAYDLLKRLLDLNPATRITAEEALEHPFLKEP